MSKSDVLITLIKEVVKNEVKQQVKEEVAKLIKSGVLVPAINKKSNTNETIKSSVKKQTASSPSVGINRSNTKQRTLSKDPMLNEILNSTTPFTADQRRDGGGLAGMMGGSVLDAIHRDSENGWGEINLSTKNMNYQPAPQVTVESTGNEAVDIVAKALTRDYTELVKRFK
jgi:hypothetical protein